MGRPESHANLEIPVRSTGTFLSTTGALLQDSELIRSFVNGVYDPLTVEEVQAIIRRFCFDLQGLDADGTDDVQSGSGFGRQGSQLSEEVEDDLGRDGGFDVEEPPDKDKDKTLQKHQDVTALAFSAKKDSLLVTCEHQKHDSDVEETLQH